MAIVYALLRLIAFALMKKAAWKHERAKKRLAEADKVFHMAENECKAEEVAVGRPANFASQFKLMKVFEVRDRAHQHWLTAAKRLKKRQQSTRWLRGLSGRTAPYSIGLVDMALALLAWDSLQQAGIDWEQLTEFVARLN